MKYGSALKSPNKSPNNTCNSTCLIMLNYLTIRQFMLISTLYNFENSEFNSGSSITTKYN